MPTRNLRRPRHAEALRRSSAIRLANTCDRVRTIARLRVRWRWRLRGHGVRDEVNDDDDDDAHNEVYGNDAATRATASLVAAAAAIGAGVVRVGEGRQAGGVRIRDELLDAVHQGCGGADGAGGEAHKEQGWRPGNGHAVLRETGGF